jgi:glycosyltransferase involved in cell wall biosynthesis
MTEAGRRLRVLLVNHFPLEGSGSGTYVRSVAADLVRRGHRVRVVAPDHEPPSGYPFEVDTIRFRPEGAVAPRREARDGSLPFDFPCFTTHPRSRRTFESLSDEELAAYRSAFRDAIHRAIDGLAPDVVHGQHLWIASAIAGESSVPLVATSHGTDLIGLDRDPRGLEDARRAAKAARRILAVSTWVARAVVERLSADPRNVRVVWNGIDPAVFRVVPVDRADLLRRHGLPAHYRRVVLYMGKLAWFKGTDVLLAAAARYRSRLADAATLIVGEGEMRDDLVRQKAALGLEDVHLLGHQTLEEIVRMYSAADLAVVPSRGEPFGLVALEAMACGTPVVATRAGGLPDFIDDRLGGLVPEGDAGALADRIVREIEEECKERKGPVCARHVLENFTWSAQVDRIEAVYREVLSKAE